MHLESAQRLLKHCSRGHTSGSLDTAARKCLARIAGSCTISSGLLLLAQSSLVTRSSVEDPEVVCTAVDTKAETRAEAELDELRSK